MITFSKWTEDGTKVEVIVNGESTLDEVLAEFQNFLRGCGYMIAYNHSLELVNIDD